MGPSENGRLEVDHDKIDSEADFVTFLQVFGKIKPISYRL